MTGNFLVYRRGAPVGEIVLQRTVKRNAMSLDMWRALETAASMAGADTGARVIIVRGDGGDFCAGADIDEMAAPGFASEAASYFKTMQQALDVLAAVEKPVIAIIEGACIGGGCAIALACDFRIAAKSARFSIPPAKLGIAYPLADTRRLVAAIGMRAARDLLMTARTIGGDEAHLIGLIDQAHEAPQLAQACGTLAAALCTRAPFSLRAAKHMLRLLHEGATDGDARALSLVAEGFAGRDFEEGVRAFLEKRPPEF